MATPTRRLAALLAGITDNDQATKVTTAGINDDAVNAAKIAANAVGTSEVADNVLTATDLAANSVGESELSVDYTAQSVPHIIPGVLQPAVDGKLLNGANHSGAYGTAQTQSGGDGHSYYYTNIKGSKPIKDPRIGAYFGSQRHKFKSLQLLELETATHGKNVYSVDGREWVRVVGNELSTSYGGSGHFIMGNNVTAGSFMEVVGYFLDANFLNEQHTADRNLTVQVNGNTAVAFNDYNATVGSPLGGRYVDEAVLINIDLPTKNSASLGINTLRINFVTGSYPRPAGIELIAQDTSNRNNIQIPSQDVVSYGKKFTVSETPHYDPFNGFVDDTTLFSAKVDTATSLGLGTATTWGASWDTGSDNHIRPFNGGRVIKWVDSGGTIKTSVTMMPRNAQHIGTTVSNEITDVSSTNSHTINFSDDAVEHSLSEVAKLWHAREFGNGNANLGHLGTYKDASMVDSADNRNIAFVMDDGLTSLSGKGVNWVNGLKLNDSTANIYITFIGTGISLKFDTSTNSGVFGGTDHYEIHIDGIEIEDYTNGDSVSGNLDVYAQNLPYGTHILRLERIAANTTGLELLEVSIHQPKKPPIPEDACVLADYMLMADWVASTGDQHTISKGARYQSCSRDMFYDENTNASFLFSQGVGDTLGWKIYADPSISSGTATTKLPYFGTHFSTKFYASNDGTVTSGSDGAQSVTSSDQGSGYSGRQNHTYATLGANIFKSAVTGGYWHFNDMEVHTPIHTSSHYQTFETPFLHELVGGDRNMEQTNLVVSPDNKTWDEVTRDVSYLGPRVAMTIQADTSGDHSSEMLIFTKHRGGSTDGYKTEKYYKGIAFGYDRVIILEEGAYEIAFGTYSGADDVDVSVKLNDAQTGGQRATGALRNFRIDRNDDVNYLIETLYLKRGDFICIATNTTIKKAHSILRLRKIN